ncbi:MAG: hypothetical protein CM1200mP26_26020 [Acidimicrobiales bacterium]|nr:MAG: hypothetical protein CM1200mP26_26020 [Acidimicrobiales bacterium]
MLTRMACALVSRFVTRSNLNPLDTAGAVRFAAVDAGIVETFLVLNGDVLTDLDVSAMVDRHRTAGATGTIALTEVDDPSHYGVVDLVPVWEPDREVPGKPVAGVSGLVRGFVEKPLPGEAPSRWVNGGDVRAGALDSGSNRGRSTGVHRT